METSFQNIFEVLLSDKSIYDKKQSTQLFL
jgi:hypothetical protein